MRHPLLSHPHLAAAAVAFAATLLGCPALSRATTASVQINAGSLSFINSTPADIGFPVATLGGVDQTVTQAQAFDVSDATGTNAGWNIQATSTTFTAAGHALSDFATTIASAPTGSSCDASTSCTLAANSVSYPYTLPAGTTAPTPTKMLTAAANSGMGDQTNTPIWSLAVPAGTWAGGAANPYTSTWTFTLVSGP